MRFISSIFIFFILGGESLYAQDLVVDGLSKIDECIELSRQINLKKSSLRADLKIRSLNYGELRSSLTDAEQRFYRLEIDESDRIASKIISDISDSVVSKGGKKEIFDLFLNALSHKLLIILSKKEEEKAREFLKEYIPIISATGNENRKMHPILKAFLSANLDRYRDMATKDNASSDPLKKALSGGVPFSIDGTEEIPQSLLRGKHILILQMGDDTFRVLVRDFSEDFVSPIYAGEYKGHRVYLVYSEDSLAKFRSMHRGEELLYCLSTGSGVITAEGKMLSKEEALLRDVKVEIIKTEDIEQKKGNKMWWVYAIGGFAAAAIVTSIVIMNSQGGGEEHLGDKIKVK